MDRTTATTMSNPYLIDFVHLPGDERPFLLDDLPVGGVLHVFEVEAVRQTSHFA